MQDESDAPNESTDHSAPILVASAVASAAILIGCIFVASVAWLLMMFSWILTRYEHQLERVEDVANLKIENEAANTAREQRDLATHHSKLAEANATKEAEQAAQVKAEQASNDRRELEDRLMSAFRPDLERIETRRNNERTQAREDMIDRERVLQSRLSRKAHYSSRFGEILSSLVRNQMLPLDRAELPILVTANLESRLSWRVQILPAMGLSELHSRFHHDEPWDSPHNVLLLSEIPIAFQPVESLLQKGLTPVRTPLTLDGDKSRLTRVKDIVDGLERTTLITLVGDRLAIPWTQPDCEVPLVIKSFAEMSIELDDLVYAKIRAVSRIESPVIDKPSSVALAMAHLTPSGGEVIIGHEKRSSNRPWLETILVGQDKAVPVIVQTLESEIREAHEKLQTIASALQELKRSSKRTRMDHLSWRVFLLPWLGEQTLFSKFRLDESWDSPHNLSLVAEMPDIYHCGTSNGMTRFVEISHLLVSRFCLATIVDPEDQTALIRYNGPTEGFVWTCPIDDEYSGNLIWYSETPSLILTASGRLLDVPFKLHPTKWKALLSDSGQDLFDLDEALRSPTVPLILVGKAAKKP
jgi:hypothetical protein